MKQKALFPLIALLLMLTACSTGQKTAETAAQTGTSAPSAPAVSQEQAEAIALEHAGVTADEVSALHTEYEVDDGRPEYEIEFRTQTKEYDYTVRADTGEVIAYDYDTTATTSAMEPLERDQAEAIALEHAGFTVDQVVGLRSKYEIDDGVPVYEIDFHVERTEYDYTVHAETGEILEWDMDD